MNPYQIVSLVLALCVIALVIYIVVDKICRKKELDELIEFLTKVQDRDTCNVGDMGLIPRLGRSPGEGNGCPL